jgi:hypothetical protein
MAERRRCYMRGVIDQVWENESRNGQKYLTVQMADGERYSVWDTEYFELLAPGATINYDTKQSGNFRHLTDIEQVDNNGEFPPYQPNNKEKQIARMSCLKSASEILAPVQLDPDSKREMVIGTARYFERYVFEGDPGTLPEQNDGGKPARNSK